MLPLYFSDIPSVVIQQPQYTVLIGNSITLVCTVSANPTHTTVYWRRIVNGVQTDITVTNNNKYSGSTVNTPSLTISNAENSDEGNYICYATNSIGTGQSSQTFLDVYGSKSFLDWPACLNHLSDRINGYKMCSYCFSIKCVKNKRLVDLESV